MAKSRPLNVRQLKFVAAFAGNATQAARDAGYTGSDDVLAHTGADLLRNPQVAKALAKRSEKATSKLVGSREARQQFWASIADDTGADLAQRLRASELLGKSCADFIERVEHSGKLSLEELVGAAGPK